ncbi:hypothetical protein AAFC00_002456 [Neodothiora populina]
MVQSPAASLEKAGSAVAARVDDIKNVEKEKESQWNTRNLGSRLGADAAAAVTAGVLVAPVITMIDKAIMENASGRAALVPSLKSSLKSLLLRPHTFLLTRPFFLVFSLYTTTYLTANTLDTATSTIRNTPPSTTTAGMNKFIATSTANLSICLYKDSQFAKMFGAASSSARPVGVASYALFTIRDCLTIFASFNLPPMIAPHLPASLDGPTSSLSRLGVAQFLAPAGLQLFSTPLHLLGLDLYNRAESVGWRSRMLKVGKDWLPSAIARMGRIIPAFGVGGVVNTGVRRELMGRIERV